MDGVVGSSARMVIITHLCVATARDKVARLSFDKACS